MVALDKDRKNRFLQICLLSALPLIALFCVVDYLEGDTRELIINLVMGGTLAVGMIAKRRLDNDRIVYRLCLGTISTSFLYGVAIGAGNGTVLYWLYGLPLVYLIFLGHDEGILWSAALIVLLGGYFASAAFWSGHVYSQDHCWRVLLSLLFVSILAYGLESSRHRYAQMVALEHKALQDEKQRLEAALSEVKTLTGLLPICAACKKIRDDQGYWNHVEAYIESHSEATFSHGMCPECGKQWYPDVPIRA